MTSTTAVIAGIITFLIVVTVVLTKLKQSSLQSIQRGEKPLKAQLGCSDQTAAGIRPETPRLLHT
jgi:hypothetical protein